MNGDDNNKVQVSALADGELDHSHARQGLAHMDDEARATWALYHHIGDVLRSDTMAAPVSDDFSTRFAERFADEPPLLAPQRKRLPRVAAWPTALAAVAATGFGFFLAPTLFKGHDAPLPAPPSVTASAPDSKDTLLAEAKHLPTSIDAHADYIRMHHASYSPLYGAATGGSSAVTGNPTEQ